MSGRVPSAPRCLLALVLCACSTGGTPSPAPDGGVDAHPRPTDAAVDAAPSLPAEAAAFLDALPAVWCEESLRCSRAVGSGRHDLACEPDFSAGWGGLTREEIAELLATERARFDPEAAARCLAFHRFLAESCHAPPPEEGLGCQDVLVGQQPVGAVCRVERRYTASVECQPGLRCAPTRCGLRCLPPAGEGEPCEWNGDCADGLLCPFRATPRVCGRPVFREEGEPCDYRLERCAGGLACFEGVCAPPSGRGGPCPCEEGLGCIDGVCGTLPEGADCSSFLAPCDEGLECDWRSDVPVCAETEWSRAPRCSAIEPCPEGLVCSATDYDGRCFPPAGEGEVCGDRTEPCDRGLRCFLPFEDGVYEGTCVAARPPGEACDEDDLCVGKNTCVAGRCTRWPELGEACEGDCFEGVCEEGVCEAVNGPCVTDEDCTDASCVDTPDGRRCHGGIRVEGASCWGTPHCVWGLICVPGEPEDVCMPPCD